LKLQANTKTGNVYTGQLTVPTAGKLLPLHLDLVLAEGGPTDFSITYTTDQNPTPRPIPIDRILPPWAPMERQPVITTAAPSLLTRNGDWAAGKALFFGEAKCAACHTVGGEGGGANVLGPNLSSLVHLNPESVLVDIVTPSARINPDHVSYLVTTQAGDVLSGLIRMEGEMLIITEAVDKTTRLPRAAVKELRPSMISLMPEGYKDLGPDKLRDLLTFLTTEKPKVKP
jgi:putative heme-binding domain-containing protein